MIIEALLTFEHAIAVVTPDPIVFDTHAFFITTLATATTLNVFVTVVVALIALVAEIVAFGKGNHRCDDIKMLIVKVKVDEMTACSFVKNNLSKLIVK
jgi:hypothetical protein